VGALVFRTAPSAKSSGAERRSEILLVRRAGRPLKGYWSIPGGLVETGETLEQAVCREVLEETGLRIQPVRLFEIFERIMRDSQGRPEYHYILADYVCRVVGGKLRAGDDVSEAAWAGRRDLGAYQITEGTREVIERAFRARARRT
jgi:mutator protein MutT